MFVNQTTDSVEEFVRRLSQFNLPLDVDDWVRELNSVDPYDVHPSITYDLVMMVEDKPSDYKSIGMLQFYTLFQRDPVILTVSSMDVYDIIYHCDVDQPHIPDSFKKIIVLACTEASIYLESNKAVPIDLLAKLIKIKILMMLWKMIEKRSQESSLLDQSEFYVPPAGERKGGKKDGKPPKKEDKKKGKAKDKGNGKDATETSPCGDVLNKTTKDNNKKSSTNVNVIPPIHLYVIVVGFHNPSLIECLTMNGFHLKLLVRCRESTAKSSLQSVLRSDSSFLVRQSSLGIKDLYSRKYGALRNFWNKIVDSYADSDQYHLDDSFIMTYNPPLFQREMSSSQMYFNQSETIYFHFLDALKRYEEFRELHKTYLAHLKMYRLGYASYATTSDMPYYERTMSAIPLLLSKPPFVIEGLLDEIVIRESKASKYPELDEEEYTKMRQEHGRGSAARWESLYPSTSSSTTIALSCDKVGELYEIRSQFFDDLCDQSQRENVPCHFSLTDQLKRILEFHRKNVIEYRKEPKGDLFHFLPTLDKNPFVVHESNSVDLALNYYKYIPECVKEVWFKSFKRDPRIQSCENLPETSAEDETVYRRQLQDCCDFLELEMDELINCILLLFYGKMTCNRPTDDDDSDSSFVTEHFCTQKVHFDSDYMSDIVVMASSKSQSATVENHYEKLTPTEFKWLEDLSPNVALQKFHKAQNDYCCIDSQEIEMFNAVLFRFHNNCDEFGLTQDRWKVTLRTPINFREFMHMAVFNDTNFLLAHEDKRKAIVNFYNEILRQEEIVNSFSVDQQDFLFRESLKVLLANPDETETDDTTKKGKKDTRPKGGDKRGKTTGKSTVKGKSRKETNPRDIVEKEPFEPGITLRELAEDRKVKEHVNKLRLPALDYDRGPLRSAGSTTTFHSLDNFTIAIDKYKITNYPLSVSASVTMDGNTLHVHRNPVDEFAFHINLKSGGIVAIGKTPQAPERKMKFYLVEELENKHMHCLGGSVPKRRETIVASTFFHDMVRRPEMSSLQGEQFLLGATGKTQSLRSLTSKRTSWMKDAKAAKEVESLSSIIPLKRKGGEMKGKGLSSVKLQLSEDENDTFNLSGFAEDVLKFKEYLPKARFRILSSRLHRYSYVSRKKSDLEIILADILRYVLNLCRKEKKCIKVKHVYEMNAEKSNDEQSQKEGDATVEEDTVSFRVTLPNGLHIKNIFRESGNYITQEYMSKGPESADIADEEYRVFLEDGNTIIRKLTGDLIVYQANGEIIHYELPLKVNKWSPFYLFKKRDDNKKNVEDLLETIRRRVKRTNKAALERYECRHTVSRTSSGYRRKQFKCRKAFTLKEIKFTKTTCEGKTFYYHNGNISQTSKRNCESDEQIQTCQTIFKRPDGTVSILNRRGILETTFADGTRITSWCDSDRDLVELNLSNKGYKTSLPPFTKVNIYYQYEHPRYASITLDTTRGNMKLNVPGNIKLRVATRTCSVVSDERTLIYVDPRKIVMESIPCEDCNKYSICKVNSKPLFYNNAIQASEPFLKAKDTFNKFIITNFEGNIKRNVDYIREEMPCTSMFHRRYPPQQIMLMFKDLRAKYLWSETMYSNRIADTMKSENTQLVLYVNDENFQVETTEIRVYEPNFYNGNFSSPYLPSKVVNEDVAKKIDIDQAACMKQTLLHILSISNLRCLLDFIRKDEELMKTDCMRTFNIHNFLSTFYKNDIPVENNVEATTSTTDARAVYTRKMRKYRHKLAELHKEVDIAKDKKNIVPYFARKSQTKKSGRRIVTDQTDDGRLIELHSERSGESNRSVTGSILDTTSKSTTMSDGTFDLLKYITSNDIKHIYKREPSYTVTIKDDDDFPQNVFSITTMDDLIVTPIKSKSDVRDPKKEKVIIARKLDTQNVKRPESKLRFADDAGCTKAPDTPCLPTIETREEDVSSIKEDVAVQTSEADGCMKDLEDSFRNLVLQGTLEEDLSSFPQTVKERVTTDNIANDISKAQEMEPGESYKISAKIEHLFNIVIKKPEEKPIETSQPPSLHEVETVLSTKVDSLEFDVGSDLGKDYVTSPSLQTVTSQMQTPSALEQFSNFEIQTLLAEAGVSPLRYHEISEMDLVKQLMGLSGASTDRKKDERPQDMEYRIYEGMMYDKKAQGDDGEDLLGSDEEKLESSTPSSSLSSKDPDRCKKVMVGAEEVVEEEEVEEEEYTSTTPSRGSITSLHKGPPYSDESIRASVFDFPSFDQERGDLDALTDASMIPLFNEKSLMRAIKKDVQKVSVESSIQIAPRPDLKKMLADISSSTSFSEVMPLSCSDTSSDRRTDSTSNEMVSFSSTTSNLADRCSIESPTPPSTSSMVNIDPSLRVFFDRASYDAKFYNVTVESVGVSTTRQAEAGAQTDLPYVDGQPDDN